MPTCPECGSRKVSKERYLGAQTGDLVCHDCGESGSPSRFRDARSNSSEDEPTESNSK